MNGIFMYIDPGTGSMLFSVAIGLVASLYFLFKALWIKLKFLVSGKTFGKTAERQRIPFVIYSEGNQYWNVFRPVIEEFERRGIDAVYYTSSASDPVFSQAYSHVKASFIGEGNRAYAKLNFLEADTCLMTTPGLDVYQLKRSKAVGHYAHVLHSVDDATSYRLFGLDYFDAVLLSGDYQRFALRKLEELRGTKRKELPVVGCPYLDVLKEKLLAIAPEKDHGFTVLVSPSWGPSALLTNSGSRLLDPLVATGWHIIIRPHPQSKRSEKGMLEALEARYGGSANVEWDYSPENLSSLSRADAMISDFSGIIFDYTFLFGKPVLYVTGEYDDEIYDASDLEETPWKFRVLKDIGVELKDDMFPSIRDVIADACANERQKEKRAEAGNTAWEYRSLSGVRIVDHLVEKQKELSCQNFSSR